MISKKQMEEISLVMGQVGHLGWKAEYHVFELIDGKYKERLLPLKLRTNLLQDYK